MDLADEEIKDRGPGSPFILETTSLLAVANATGPHLQEVCLHLSEREYLCAPLKRDEIRFTLKIQGIDSLLKKNCTLKNGLTREYENIA